jgi:16S rRNA (guanine(1405)-N(7))-methyltransferase
MDTSPAAATVRKVVAAVLASRKYQWVAPALVQAIAAGELAKGRSLKEAIKATKNQLHQSAGAYQTGRMDYAAWLGDLRRAYGAGDPERWRQQLRAVMAHHASTAERLPILDAFYGEILAQLPPLQSVLDVACGLNPLAYAWMPLSPATRYYACDIYSDQVAFLNDFFHLAGIAGQAEVRDVVQNPPAQAVDLALMLKTIPCLEQMDRQAGARLLAALNARFWLVSFPARSLGGRQRGMVDHYAAHFETLLAGRGYPVQRFDFDGELAFLVTADQR